MKNVWTFLSAALMWVALTILASGQSAVLLPNGKQQFLDANGNPLSGGAVYMYVPPNTTTPKTTWQDAARATPNSSPITLDAAGEATIYGVGAYRQLVQDSLGNTVWDAQTSGLGGSTYGGVSTGSANAQVLAATDFGNVDGQQVSFIAGFTNTGAATVNAGFGATSVVKIGSSGPTALTGGEIVAGNYILLEYNAASTRFQLVSSVANPVTPSSFPLPNNISMGVSASANALTITLQAQVGALSASNPGYIPFRQSAVPNFVYRTVTANTTLVLSSGSTLGNVVSGENFRVWVVVFDDSGTVRLGAIKTTKLTPSSGAVLFAQYPLQPMGTASSTAEGGAGTADSSLTFYTPVAVTNKSYTVLGYVDYTNGTSTPGLWTAPNIKANYYQGLAMPGTPVQVQQTASNTVATGTTVIPLDNTSPLITEGDQYMAADTFTASSVTGFVCVAHNGYYSSSAAGTIITATLFDTTSGALYAAWIGARVGTAGVLGAVAGTVCLKPSISAMTFVIRAGSAVAGTTTFNGSAGAGIYNGALNSILTITEYAP